MYYKHIWHDHEAIYYASEDGLFKLAIFYEAGIKTAVIHSLIVFPENRGKGRGRMLMAIAIGYAKREGCARVCLWADCEPWVLEWYQRLGFVADPRLEEINGLPGLSLTL